MSLASRWSIERRLLVSFAALVLPVAAQLPDGAGRAETQKLCSQCHELERSISLRQDRGGWQATVTKMASLGMEASDKDLAAVVDYLTAHYPSEQLPKLNVNKAAAIEFESRLSLKRSEAAAIIAYRTKNGPFQSLDDLKKVPGIDVAKVEARKDRLTFE
jgi:competence protein ComEA